MIAYISFSILFAISLYFNYAYVKYKKNTTQKIKEFKEIGTHRNGYYIHNDNSNVYRGIVHIIEIDRYSNGISKIKLDKIESCIEDNYVSVKDSAMNRFVSLKPTKDIEWLESTDQLKKDRLKKLDELEKE